MNNYQEDMDPNIQYAEEIEEEEDDEQYEGHVSEDNDEGGDEDIVVNNDRTKGYSAATTTQKQVPPPRGVKDSGQTVVALKNNPGLVAGANKKMRPQSAKTGDEQRFRFNSQQYTQQPQYPPLQQQQQWIDPMQGGQQQYTQQYQFQQQHQAHSNSNPMIQQAQQPQTYQGFYPGGAQQPQQPSQNHLLLSNIKQQNLNMRPTTASWSSNQKWPQIIPGKNQSAIEIEANRLRPRVVNQEREALYEDALKQKLTANMFKDENVKLRTRLHMLEVEMQRKDRVIEEMLMRPEGGAPSSGQVGSALSGNLGKIRKLQSHLTQNLKRRIKEMQIVITQKSEELDSFKRSMKTTKQTEMEVEVRQYMEECQRLRQQLEEVIKSKDTFADPDELKLIEDRFQAQENVITGLRQENSELAQGFSRKEDEIRQLREFITDAEKRKKQKTGTAKDVLKARKTVKDKEREIISQLKVSRMQTEELRSRLEEVTSGKKPGSMVGSQISNTRPQTAGGANNTSQLQTSSIQDRQLKQELADKEEKVKELGGVISQLQSKVSEKVQLLQKEQQEKQKYKDLYEQYQGQVARLEAQIESGSGHVIHQREESPVQRVPTKQEQRVPSVQGVDPVEPKAVQEMALELKLKLQAKSFTSSQIKDFFFKPFYAEAEVSIRSLKHVLEINGFKDTKALLLARYLIEPRDGGKRQINDGLTASQAQVVKQLSVLVGDYKVYSDAFYRQMLDRAQKVLARCKDTLRETLQLEDYEEEGIVTVASFREAFSTLQIEGVDKEMLDFLLYVVYSKSESLDQLRYGALFDLVEGRLSLGGQSLGASTESRKRPESSSPEKLKARNQPAPQQQAVEEEEQYEEEEFEKLLDKGDEEDDGSKSGAPTTAKKEGYIDEEEMLDVAEKCFMRIAEAIIARGLTVRDAFKRHVGVDDMLSPLGFLEAVKGLGIADLEEIDVACLMRILTKPDLDNAIMLSELIIIMENFGIQDSAAKGTEADEAATPQKQRKSTGPGGQGGIDLSALDEKSIKILAKLMLALMELNVSLHDFFEGVIFEQLVKTKQQSAKNGARKVEIIDAKDFFGYLQARGVRKSDKPHMELQRLLQLDPNYPDLILVKRLAKAIDEIAKNEELMEGILAAAAEGNEEAEEGGRLVTIGEEDDKNTATQQTQKVQQQRQEEEEEDVIGEDDEYI